jgi:two-component system nitrogen regulation response regulator NtrX
MSADILVVDDGADIRELIAGILQDGDETRLAHNSTALMAIMIAGRRGYIDIWLKARR